MPRFMSIAPADATTPRPIHGVLTSASGMRLVVSALPGVRLDGTLPDGLEHQTMQAFDNLATLIEAAGLRREDIVAVAAYVAAPGAKAMIHRVATAKLGGFRPTTSVRQVMSLSQAGSMIEIDAEAVAED